MTIHNTKIHLAEDAKGTTHDCKKAIELSDGFKAGALLADRRYDSDAIIAFDASYRGALWRGRRNESLVGKALKPIRDKVVIATKHGISIKDGHMVMDSRPGSIRSAVESSLTRLQTDYIDLYYTHRVDPKVATEAVAEAMAQLHHEGKIRNWGISEPSMETLCRANKVFPVAAIESEYNMMWREPEQEILPTLEKLGIRLVPYRPLARGFLSDSDTGMFLEGAKNTRFDERNLSVNMKLKKLVQEFAADKGISAAQFALGWLLE